MELSDIGPQEISRCLVVVRKRLSFKLVNSINLYKSYEQILNLPIFSIDLCYVNVNQTFFG